MRTNLLRAKMAMLGDFYIKDLEKILDLDYQAIQKRLSNRISFKPSEIKTISEHYHLTANEVNEIFELGGKEDES